MVFVCLFNELCQFSSGCVPEGEYVVFVAFSNERFDCALAHGFCFNSAHENIGKGDCSMAVPCEWRLFFPFNLNEFS